MGAEEFNKGSEGATGAIWSRAPTYGVLHMDANLKKTGRNNISPRIYKNPSPDKYIRSQNTVLICQFFPAMSRSHPSSNPPNDMDRTI